MLMRNILIQNDVLKYNIWKYLEILWNTVKYLNVIQDVLKYPEFIVIFWSISKYPEAP